MLDIRSPLRSRPVGLSERLVSDDARGEDFPSRGTLMDSFLFAKRQGETQLTFELAQFAHQQCIDSFAFLQRALAHGHAEQCIRTLETAYPATPLPTS